MAERDRKDDRERIRAAVSATPECLSSLQLEALLLDEQANKAAADHVRTCPHCLTELTMLRAFESGSPLPAEGAAIGWIAAQLDGKISATTSTPAPATDRGIWNRLFGGLPRAAPAFALVAALAVGLGIYEWRKTTEPQLQVPSGEGQNYRSTQIRLLEPSGDLRQFPDSLRWEPVANSSKYVVKVMEVDNTVLWSGESFHTSMTFPPELKGRIPNRKTILWQVEALDQNGRIAATSTTFRFRVLPDADSSH